jgi:metal-responsive CopG/Arc/MetJ family transcriptional regulator
MKTAISLPDDLFASTDALAERLGMSRSALIAAALTEFIAKHRSTKISERLNAVYGTEESRVAEPLRAAQRRAIGDTSGW